MPPPPFLSKRAFLIGTAATGLSRHVWAQDSLAVHRPALLERKFTSPAVEAYLTAVIGRLRDRRLAVLFENAFPNTLDTTVTVSSEGAEADTFIITGDIDAMWLRDSSEQVRPYLPLARKDKALQRLFRGLITRQARSILIDPYANAFMRDPLARTNLSWARDDMTEMKPGVAERKWEVDSLCHVIRLSHDYWQATGDVSPFDATWRAAMTLIIKTLREQQRKTGKGPYHFQRVSETPSDTLPLDGYGPPTRKIGLIHSGFRPSDDACLYPFNIPDNHFAVVALRHLATLAPIAGLDTATANDAAVLAQEIAVALKTHGTMADQTRVWAYEIDGFGNRLFMDDANIPSLLSLPYIGACAIDDPLYRTTRHAILSNSNPYFFKGTAGEGIGGPHIGLDMIWPMSIIMRALTSVDDREIATCLDTLAQTTAGSGFIHEAFNANDPNHFTRPWFAWGNALFAVLINHLMHDRPHLLT